MHQQFWASIVPINGSSCTLRGKVRKDRSSTRHAGTVGLVALPVNTNARVDYKKGNVVTGACNSVWLHYCNSAPPQIYAISHRSHDWDTYTVCFIPHVWLFTTNNARTQLFADDGERHITTNKLILSWASKKGICIRIIVILCFLRAHLFVLASLSETLGGGGHNSTRWGHVAGGLGAIHAVCRGWQAFDTYSALGMDKANPRVSATSPGTVFPHPLFPCTHVRFECKPGFFC